MAEDEGEAAVRTVARYFHLLNAGAFALLYAEVMDRRTRDRMGRDRFVCALEELAFRGRARLHALEGVRVEGASARVRVAAALAGFAGDLEFELVREDGGWRVARFTPLNLEV
ncbi:MAG TPA: hypothetical protein VIO14_00460 [Dehalococcoidia bacterium]